MEKFEMWDFICVGAILFSVWMNTYGLKMCREANKEGFNEKSVRNKALGAGVAAVLYLIVRFFG